MEAKSKWLTEDGNIVAPNTMDSCVFGSDGKSLKEKLPFKFGIDENGKYGYFKINEETVTPFGTDTGDSGDLIIFDQNYSEEEQLTSKRWVDGKPIYQKTFVGELPSQSGAVMLTECGIPNIEKVIDYEWILSSGDETSNRLYKYTPWYTGGYVIPSEQTADHLEIYLGSNGMGGFRYKYTCFYTKTTDTADSPVNIPTLSKLPFELGIDDEGNYGYIKNGENTVTPFGTNNSTNTSESGRTYFTIYRSDISSFYLFSKVDTVAPIEGSISSDTDDDLYSYGYPSTADLPTDYTFNSWEEMTTFLNRNKDILFDQNGYYIRSINNSGATETGDHYIISDLDYSTEEQLTGKRWTDGKPIYQITITGTGNNSSENHYKIDNPINDLDVIANIDCTAKITSTVSAATEVPNMQMSNGSIVANYIQSENQFWLRQTQTSGNSVYEYKLTIFYTKTTDTAASPVAPPKVEAMHVYSTEEKVVGTWIDDQKIYEKTWKIDNTTATSNWDVTNADFENIAFVVKATLYDTDSETPRSVPVKTRKLSSTSIRFYTGDSWLSIDAYTIQYVKTTATPN